MEDFRRPKGTMRDPVASGWRIERENRDQFARWAHQVGLSAAQLLDYIIEHPHVERDPDGLPTWIPRELRSKEARLIE